MASLQNFRFQVIEKRWLNPSETSVGFSRFETNTEVRDTSDENTRETQKLCSFFSERSWYFRVWHNDIGMILAVQEKEPQVAPESESDEGDAILSQVGLRFSPGT